MKTSTTGTTAKKSGRATSGTSKTKAATTRNTRSTRGTAKSSASSKKSASYASQEDVETMVAPTPFENLFEDLLKDIYWAETHLTDALEEMTEAATTKQLKSAFQKHAQQTEEHIARLEKAFELLGKEAEAKKCDAMDGLIKEAKSIIKETEEGSMTRDAGLIIAAQKVEHYEIASYGSLVQVAITLGHHEVADLLDQTLEEEEQTDMDLTRIAEGHVNPMADQETEEDQEEEEE